MKLQIGATLQNGKYQLNQTLGHESLGATYVATQTLLKQPVVIKTLDPSLQVTQSFPQLKERFTEEIRLLARCQHPSLVRVLDFFQEDQLPFLVMDYVPGQTLYDRVSTPGAPPLTEAEAIHYMRQIASALSIAHRTGLIHQNIRPETIIRRQGTNLGILVGFGFAHEVAIPALLQNNPFAPADPDWSLTNRFAIDLYSLAATLYYLLTRETPHSDFSLESYSWSPATKQAIFRGLTRDPQWQAQTVDEWLRLLPNTTLPLMPSNTPENNRVPASSNGSPLKGRTQEPRVSLPSIPNGAPPISEPTQLPVLATPTKTPEPVLPNTPSLTAPVQSVIIKPTRNLPKFLLLAIVAAGAIGLGFGFALRLSAAKAPGTSILQPIQPFAEKDWKGTLKPSDNLIDAPVESNSTKSSKTRQKKVDPEVDPAYTIPKPQIQQSEYLSPIQPRPPRAQSESIVPAPPKPVKPSVEPVDPSPALETAPTPEEITSPKLDPSPVPIAPAPVQPSTRSVEPRSALPRSNGRE